MPHENEKNDDILSVVLEYVVHGVLQVHQVTPHVPEVYENEEYHNY